MFALRHSLKSKLMQINHHENSVLDLEKNLVIIFSNSFIILKEETELHHPYIASGGPQSQLVAEKPKMHTSVLTVQCLFHYIALSSLKIDVEAWLITHRN